MQEMTPGGEWLAEGGTGTPHYVVNPDHIARLKLAGYQVVADPRIPGDFNQPEKGIEEENDDTSSRIPTVGVKPANEPGAGSVDTASG
jgi:hypothetical protein